MPNLIGNLELETIPNSDVIWKKKDLSLLGSPSDPSRIVRALKLGNLGPRQPLLFRTLEELLSEADAQFYRVAQLTGTAVVSRHSIGISKLPEKGLTRYEHVMYDNPYLTPGHALVAEVDVITKAGRIPPTSQKNIIRGAERYMSETEDTYFWGDFTKTEGFQEPFAGFDQFTYGYSPNDFTPQVYLTDIDPIIYSDAL